MYGPCPVVAVADRYSSFRMPPIQWIVLIWYTMPLIIMPLLYNIQNRKNFEAHIIEWLWWSSFETCTSACVRVYVFVNLMHCGNKIQNRGSAIAKMDAPFIVFKSSHTSGNVWCDTVNRSMRKPAPQTLPNKLLWIYSPSVYSIFIYFCQSIHIRDGSRKAAQKCIHWQITNHI